MPAWGSQSAETDPWQAPGGRALDVPERVRLALIGWYLS